MTIAAPRRSGTRRSRFLAALSAVVLLAAIPFAGTLAAAAGVPTGYLGASDDAATFDNNSGDRTLDLMTDGVAYSDTISGPQFIPNMAWCWSIDSGSLPGGISMSTPSNQCAPYATFSGTPEPGDFEFTVRLADSANETVYYLAFSGAIESAKSPTVTTLTAPTVAPYDSIPLSATVDGNPVVGSPPSGTVEFYADGTTLLGSGVITDGVATATGDLSLSAIGQAVVVTAKYLGDDAYKTSTSTGSSTLIYAPTVSGMVLWNGELVEDAVVELFEASDVDREVAIDTAMTLANGAFTLSPGAITTSGAATAEYFLQVTYPDSTVLYYATGEWNVTDLDDATQVGPSNWDEAVTIERRTAPVWDDSTLATPRVGGAYSDAVSATSQNAVTYSVDAGDLPAGLSLDAATGAITGEPDACSDGQTPFPFRGMSLPSCDYDFTIKADNGYGSVSKQFTGTLLPAGVGPTWEDDELVDFQVGVAVDDSVLAEGDPTIVYSVSGGTLPAGLTLDSSTGALTGTPTTAGPYEFTITAENDFGSITADFEGDVAAAPVLNLVLDFAAGTSIEDAASTISADGLQVGSTYTLTMFSTPRVLYTGTIGGSGGFTWVVSLPADTPAGSHRLLLTGIAADGTPMSAEAWFSLRADGTIGAISYSGPISGLAVTGVEVMPTVFGAIMLLLLGIGAVTVARRRNA
jgi:hypothetical protein